MEAAEIIKGLRDKTGMTRKAFSDHLGIPVRTVEDWEKGKRTPPEYIPRLIAYQLKYEELIKKLRTLSYSKKNTAEFGKKED